MLPRNYSTSLKHHLSYWKRITRNKVVLSIIEHGLKFPSPSRNSIRWHRACRTPPRAKHDLAKTLTEWLEHGVITPASPKDIMNLFFPVYQKNKFRWVIDCKVLNTLIVKQGVRYEGISKVRELIQKGDLLTSIDVKGAFLHIPIEPNSRYWLQFLADGVVYEFQTLPFGVSSAPFYWTKILSQIIHHLRRQAIRISVYMDDILIAAKDKETSIAHTTVVLDNLQAAGITINFEKSRLNPSTSIQHIGFIWHTSKNLILLPVEKIRDISRSARKLLNEANPTARSLARTIGKLTACSTAFLPAVYKRRALNEDLQKSLRSHSNWNGPVHLSATTIANLRFFASPTLMKKFNGRPLILSRPLWQLTTDAAPYGWGATLLNVETNVTLFTKGQFSLQEQKQSSNWKETSALTFALMAFKDIILRSPGPIHFRTDNTTSLSYLRKMGGTIPSLQVAIDPLLRFLIRHRIPFTAMHLPGILNTEADRLSRSRRRDHDYHLDPSFFRSIERATTPFTIDLFASRINAQKARFCSRLPDPKATYRDAFSTDWSREHCFAFPPIPLIPKVLSHLTANPHHTMMTLVVPIWPSSSWWPTLLQLSAKPPTPIPHRLISHGSSPSSALSGKRLPPMTAFHLSNFAC